MNTGVTICLIICATLVIITVINNLYGKGGGNK